MLASLGLASVTVGSWITKYRPFFVITTMTLLGISFYRTYSGKGSASPWARAILWVTATASVGLSVYALFFAPK